MAISRGTAAARMWSERTPLKGLRRLGTLGLASALVLAILTGLCGAASAEPWFQRTSTIITKSPKVNKCGETPKKTELTSEGGQAAALFEDNGDGIPDIVIVNGSPYYFVDQGKRNAAGAVEYSSEPSAISAGEINTGHTEKYKSLGLADFKRNGRLDLYLANSGKGSLALKNPNNPSEWNNPENVETGKLCLGSKYRTFLNNGNGTFSYENLGEEGENNTREALFADFSGDGRQDALLLAAPYYGIYRGNSTAPSALLPGEAGGKFGKNILQESVVNENGELEHELFEEQYGRGKVDFKGATVRDFTGNGKPDIIAAAFSDVSSEKDTEPPIESVPAGSANVELEKGIPAGGYEGAWPHGLMVLRNVSTPGHIKFVNESATADEIGLSVEAGMEVYGAIPVDLNHDGKPDLVVLGARNWTGFDSVQQTMPLIEIFKNISTPEHIRFENVTKQSGLQFMNEPNALREASNGLYPTELAGYGANGEALPLWPNMWAGAAIDVNDSGNPDLVLVDRQYLNSNPTSGEEYFPWVFENEGDFKFRWVKPAESGLTHTARDLTYGDIEGNGREDIVTVNGAEGVTQKTTEAENDNFVWTNELKTSNNWVEIKVRSATDGLGPLGLGAKVTVYKAGTTEILGDEEMRTDFDYRSRRDAILHFGLGSASAVDVRVGGEGLGTPVTVHDAPIDRVDTITLAPEAPALSSGVTPNNTGVFTLSWAGPGGNNGGFTYTLQQKNASGVWTNVASGLSGSEYAFTSGRPEGEGTWTYRVTASYEGVESEPSAVSVAVKVDETAPVATPSAERPPDYLGGGGWYKDAVTVSFADSSDPSLSDGSPGSGVNPASIPAAETFSTSGAHTACGNVGDYAGNVSKQGCLTVQVDATPPSLEITCPATAVVGSSASATYTAADEYSGLASSASGTVPIDTSSAGEKTASTTAVSNVGLETTKSCTTEVGYPNPGAPALSAGVTPN
jgi:hypothetical protein